MSKFGTFSFRLFDANARRPSRITIDMRVVSVLARDALLSAPGLPVWCGRPMIHVAAQNKYGFDMRVSVQIMAENSRHPFD
jgi:hypothetical protein